MARNINSFNSCRESRMQWGNCNAHLLSSFLGSRVINIKARHPAIAAKKQNKVVKVTAIEVIEPNNMSPRPINIEIMDPARKQFFLFVCPQRRLHPARAKNHIGNIITPQ
tara:strand:- start:1260 stop:1589 length:330 start_codon:yes stop_codon:yes gene_type:complete